MRVLLDTHTFLWQVSGDSRLSNVARETLLSPEHDLLFSMASLWEIAIKISLGKLALADDWPKAISAELTINQIRRLPIENEHCARVGTLPFHHRDPFDRMLIAQAMTEDLVILSRDAAIGEYPVTRIW